MDEQDLIKVMCLIFAFFVALIDIKWSIIEIVREHVQDYNNQNIHDQRLHWMVKIILDVCKACSFVNVSLMTNNILNWLLINRFNDKHVCIGSPSCPLPSMLKFCV